MEILKAYKIWACFFLIRVNRYKIILSNFYKFLNITQFVSLLDGELATVCRPPPVWVPRPGIVQVQISDFATS